MEQLLASFQYKNNSVLEEELVMWAPKTPSGHDFHKWLFAQSSFKRPSSGHL